MILRAIVAGWLWLGAACGAATAASVPPPTEPTLIVGSKRFTESYVLGELLAEQARRDGLRAEHRAGLGTTGIVAAALSSGAIDVYVEYTGTIARDLLGLPDTQPTPPLTELNRRLAGRGLAASVPLGFNNGYAVAMRCERAAALGVRRIGDLATQPALRLAFTQEFLALPAGWPGLARAYGLPHAPAGIEHGLAYGALAAGRIDAKEVYTTDARIKRDGLCVLEDDRRFFPRYDAVLLHRADFGAKRPRAAAALARLAGRIDEATMIRLNDAVETAGVSFGDAARWFLDGGLAGVAATTAPAPSTPSTSSTSSASTDSTGSAARTAPEASVAPTARRSLASALFAEDMWLLTAQHLALVGVSVAAGVLVGVPIGVAAWRFPRAGGALLAVVGIVQTVPSLALLALLIAAMGRIGTAPAMVALSLYALLPIVRNTQAGLAGVSPGLREAAAALGLTRRQALTEIELPLALPMIVAGVSTAAVINVGTATIAAFVGAGGYGARIVQGLALNDATLLLAGALPSAALALLVQAGFRWLGGRRVLSPQPPRYATR